MRRLSLHVVSLAPPRASLGMRALDGRRCRPALPPRARRRRRCGAGAAPGDGDGGAGPAGGGGGASGAPLSPDDDDDDYAPACPLPLTPAQRLSRSLAPLVPWASPWGVAPGGVVGSGAPPRHKAELYLVRTDGFTCTRETVTDSTLRFSHPSTQQQMLMWKTRPAAVLVLKKLGDEVFPQLLAALTCLRREHGLRCVVERDVYERLAGEEGFGFVETFYSADAERGDLARAVDFVVCLGGDGVILHAASLFNGPAPPIISFNLGSLGFLTNHRFENFTSEIAALLGGEGRAEGAYITLRMRLHCELLRRGCAVPERSAEVLNEVVVHRGNNSYLSKIECFERDRLLTKVQADGIMIATPTGSTAYSVAAGGSMVHPTVPAILFTPICPHSLSFRPVVLPDSAELELRIPTDARDTAWVSFDGKMRVELRRGDAVRVRMSPHPLPTINKADQTNDWFGSLARCLRWNDRAEQRALFLDRTDG